MIGSKPGHQFRERKAELSFLYIAQLTLLTALCCFCDLSRSSTVHLQPSLILKRVQREVWILALIENCSGYTVLLSGGLCMV